MDEEQRLTMSTEVMTGIIEPATYAGTDMFRVEVRRNGIATSGHLVNKARMGAFVEEHQFATVTMGDQVLDLSDARLDISPYFEGDRAALIIWLKDAVKYHQRIVEEYKRGQRGKNLDAAGRSEMLAVNKAALVDAEQQLRLQQAALAVGL